MLFSGDVRTGAHATPLDSASCLAKLERGCISMESGAIHWNCITREIKHLAFSICPVQTRIWWACIQAQLNHRTMLSVFGGKDGVVERKYGEYPTGKRAPSIATIDEVEAKLPGTRQIILNLLWPILHGETVPTCSLRSRGDVTNGTVSAPLTFEGIELHLVAAMIAIIDQSTERLILCVDQLNEDALNLQYVPELNGDLEGFTKLFRIRTEAITLQLKSMQVLQRKIIADRDTRVSPSCLFALVSSRRESHIIISLSTLPSLVFAINASQVVVSAITLTLSAVCTFWPNARNWYAVDRSG